MAESILERALDYRLKNLIELHQELKEKYGIDFLYLPERVRRELKDLGTYAIALTGKYGSGKTAILAASYLYIKKANENLFLGNAMTLLKDKHRMEYDGIFVDEVHRLILEAKTSEDTKLQEEFGHLLREYFDNYKPIMVVAKEKRLLEPMLIKAGSAITESRIKEIDLNQLELRTEIIEFLEDRNFKLLNIAYGEKLIGALKKKLSQELERRKPHMLPRMLNVAMLSGNLKEANLEHTDGIRSSLEHSIRRTVERYYVSQVYTPVVDGVPVFVKVIRSEASKDRGADAELVLGVYSLREEKTPIDTFTIGIEVKTVTSGFSRFIKEEQRKLFLQRYKGILYFVFSTKPISVSLSDNERYINLPFYLSYLATTGKEWQTYIGAYLSEGDPLKDLIYNIIGAVEIPEEEKKEAKEKIIGLLVDIFLDRGRRSIILEGKTRTHIDKMVLLSIVNNKGYSFTYSSLDELLNKYQRQINEELKKHGFRITVSSKRVNIYPA